MYTLVPSYLTTESSHFLYIVLPGTFYMSIKNQYPIYGIFNGYWTNKSFTLSDKLGPGIDLLNVYWMDKQIIIIKLILPYVSSSSRNDF